MEFSREISVRQLVEFIKRCGDLQTSQNSQHTAQAGSALHRKLQKQGQKKNPNYQKEVSFSYQYELAGVTFTVRGRADGLVEEEGQWVVEEIKTSEELLSELAPPQVDLFFAQGMCYAYFLMLEKDLTEVTVELVYVEVLQEDVRRTRRTYTKEALTTFFQELMAEYKIWFDFVAALREEQQMSIEEMTFPFPAYRKGQRELMGVVYKAIYSKRQLFMQAPTGTGKTMSTLFPAVKGLNLAKYPQLFYLTAKTITRQVVESGLAALGVGGLRLKTVTLTAKDKICPQQDGCDMQNCPLAKGYYDRVNGGLMDILSHEDFMTRPVIEEYAAKHQLCPFEFSLDISLFCQVIICDYNYVYDPLVYLRRFFEEIPKDRGPLLLVDEAHNLVNRAKEMYTKHLSLWQLQQAHKWFKEVKSKDALTQKGRRQFLKARHFLEDYQDKFTAEFTQQTEALEEFNLSLVNLLETLRPWLAENEFAHQEELRQWTFEVHAYLVIAEHYNEKFVTTFQQQGADFIVSQVCLDPAKFLAKRHEDCYDSLLFSATFSPIQYYEERLGAQETAVHYALSSPFEKSHQQVIVANYIDTTYHKRTENLTKIIAAISAMIDARPGNYFIFAPSYSFLNEIHQAFQQTPHKCAVYLQEREMDEGAREEFLAHFVVDSLQTTLGFVLLGGIFSEGVDLVGQRLIGAAIVGVGLPQINPLLELEKDYYQGKNQQGFQYAYQLPGLNKVFQAAGRVIRTPEDYGVVLLLDQRFTRFQYRKFLPDEWQIGVAHNPQGLTEGLQRFWQEAEKV